ncbi:hypothetical protein NE237_001383 [Protea cynaroides]|uniref:Uncharacterized protein n=1 Tax=Protea cynaroides TaxID=273540 RepID=A0A9Q0KT84_9MAGN|nr:hypothetical protein NE237_001383 [Protea cynaroides]
MSFMIVNLTESAQSLKHWGLILLQAQLRIFYAEPEFWQHGPTLVPLATEAFQWVHNLFHGRIYAFIRMISADLDVTAGGTVLQRKPVSRDKGGLLLNPLNQLLLSSTALRCQISVIL